MSRKHTEAVNKKSLKSVEKVDMAFYRLILSECGNEKLKEANGSVIVIRW